MQDYNNNIYEIPMVPKIKMELISLFLRIQNY